MSRKGYVQTEAHSLNKGLSRRREYCHRGHLMAETRIFYPNGLARGCGKCKETRRYWRDHSKDHKVGDGLYKYGITLPEYEAMFASQDGRCAICGSPPGKKRLAVDHDHESGKIRGLLCDNCNRGVGLLGDSPEILLEAAAYVRGSV